MFARDRIIIGCNVQYRSNLASIVAYDDMRVGRRDYESGYDQGKRKDYDIFSDHHHAPNVRSNWCYQNHGNGLNDRYPQTLESEQSLLSRLPIEGRIRH